LVGCAVVFFDAEGFCVFFQAVGISVCQTVGLCGVYALLGFFVVLFQAVGFGVFFQAVGFFVVFQTVGFGVFKSR